MKSHTIRIGLRTALALCSMAALSQLSARADDASAKLYQMKCVACHGADGVGNTTVGKALKISDFHDPDVQKMSDADLTSDHRDGQEQDAGV